MRTLLFFPFLFLLACTNPTPEEQTMTVDELKLNQIQVLGSHNSYKEAIEPALMQMLMAEDSARFQSLDYEHVSLTEQLELGLRKLELDVLHDPEGGRYAYPLGLDILKQAGVEPRPYDTAGLMESIGFKVLHVQELDFRSNCLRLIDCLQELKAWSDQHPKHLPITISFNAKTGGKYREDFVEALAFSSAAFDSLDAEILSMIPKERIITPDVVRGNYQTLEEAVLAQNWPTLAEARGKFLFVLDEKSQEKQDNYKAGHPSLKDRVIFILAAPGEPEAAFLFLNNPKSHQDSIKKLVQLGYLVRTRADAGTKEARRADYTRLEAALASGAQFISTDYYIATDKFGTDFKIQLPEAGVGRCNPVNTSTVSDFILE